MTTATERSKATSMNVIDIKNLRKRFGSHEVLHGIDVQIRPGSLVGFLGPNGAGKSTTIRILMGLIRKTSGTAQVFRQDSFEEGTRIRNRIGYLAGEVALYRGLTGNSLVSHIESVRKIPCRQLAMKLADDLDLDLRRTIREYSSGMKQKLGLVLSMMHDPELLILDEPTSALDPLVKRSVFELLRNVWRTGKTILFSSHSLNEVQELCEEIVILRGGRIVENQTIANLQKNALQKLVIQFAGTVPDEMPQQIAVREQSENRLTGTYAGSPNELIAWLGRQDIASFEIGRPDLEDLFLAYYHTSGDQP